MNKGFKGILSCIIALSLLGCGGGSKENSTVAQATENVKDSIEENSEVAETTTEEQEELETYNVYGASIKAPAGWKGFDKDSWYTMMPGTDNITGVRMAILSTEAGGGDVQAIISELHNNLTNSSETGEEDFHGGIKYELKTKDSNEEMTVPTYVYIYPVQQDKLVCIAICYNFEFGKYLETADYSKAYTSFVQEKETADWEVGEAFVRKTTDSIGTKYIQVIVPVTNTGTKNLYLNNGTIDLEDSDGHLVDTLNMVSAYPQILAPGETGYYIEETFDGTDGADVTALLHEKIKEATVQNIRYEVSDVSVKNGQFTGIEITGRVENTTNEDGKLVYVVAILYNSNNEPIGHAFTIMTDDLVAGDKVGFSMSTMVSPSQIKASDVDHYDIYAYPQQMQF